MKWADTIASQCRYGDEAAVLFGDTEVIWENSLDDYQGHAKVLAMAPDGFFLFYEWSYGSCSGCDDWEARGLDHDQIVAEMWSAVAVLPDLATACRFFKVTDFGERIAATNDRWDGGGFFDAGDALVAWVKDRTPAALWPQGWT